MTPCPACNGTGQATTGALVEAIIREAIHAGRDALPGMARRLGFDPGTIVDVLGPLAQGLVASALVPVLRMIGGIEIDPVRIEAIATGEIEVKTVVVPAGSLKP